MAFFLWLYLHLYVIFLHSHRMHQNCAQYFILQVWESFSGLITNTVQVSSIYKHEDYRMLGFEGTYRILDPHSSLSQMRNVASMIDMPMTISFCSLSLPFQIVPDLCVDCPLLLSSSCHLSLLNDSLTARALLYSATSTYVNKMEQRNSNTST